MFCHECGAQLVQAAKFCSSCGTAQSVIQKTEKTQVLAKQVCRACLTARTTSGAGVCADCHRRDVPAKTCENCGKLATRKGLTVGTISAYPRQECEFCAYNYFVPADLARVLHSKKPEVLSPVTIEWLFFAAWDWNCRNRRGYIPIIDVSEAGAKSYAAGRGIPSSTWTEMFWGGDLSGYFNDLLPIMERYSVYPQLWYADEESVEEGIVSIHCYPRWQTNMDHAQEQAVRASLDMTKPTNSQDEFLVGFIGKLF